MADVEDRLAQSHNQSLDLRLFTRLVAKRIMQLLRKLTVHYLARLTTARLLLSAL